MNLFRHDYSDAKHNAQSNLSGITHYVDDGTLRFHKARILACNVHDNGLLLSIIESTAMDMHNTKRGFRYVIFDVFGTTIARVGLDDCVSTKAQAVKGLYAALNQIDAVTHTLEAIDRQQQQAIAEFDELRVKVTAMTQQYKAA